MIEENSEKKENKKSSIAWVTMSLILSCYFALMIMIATIPEMLSSPLSSTNVITKGILFGLLIIILQIIISFIFTYWINQSDEPQ